MYNKLSKTSTNVENISQTDYNNRVDREMIMNDYRKNLGKVLKQQRHSANLTLHELSTISNVSPSHLGRIEKGERFPSAAILQRIAKPLGYDEDELFTLAGYLSPHLDPETGNQSDESQDKLDPYVAKVLAQEPVEVQRAVVGILTILKSIASSFTPAKTPPQENPTKNT
jgi:transcriptional regulator with XRE-family HTH domain